jgi:hypothetical protein
MAVSFTNNTTFDQTGGAEITFAHDNQDGDCLVLFAAIFLGVPYHASYGGVDMQFIRFLNTGPPISRFFGMWILPNPPAGSNTFTFTGVDAAATHAGHLVSVKGISQTAYYLTPVISQGSSTSPSGTVAVEPGDLVLSACLINTFDFPGTTISVGGSQTDRGLAAEGELKMRLTTSTVAENTFTLSNSDGWLTATIALRPVGSSGVLRPLPGKYGMEARLTSSAATAAAANISNYADWLANGNGATGALNTYAESGSGSYYYDFTKCMYFWADYLEDELGGDGTTYREAAWKGWKVLFESYYEEFSYAIQAFKHFVRGPYKDYQVRGIAENLTALESLRDIPAYAADGVDISPPYLTHPSPDVVDYTAIRELAYTFAAMIYADRAGILPARTARRADLKEWAIDYLAYTTTDEGWEGYDEYASPWMTGLLCRSLIEDWEDTGDATIIPAIRTAMNYIATNAWDAPRQAWWYNMNPDSVTAGAYGQGAVDLNMLIAPVYAWLAVRDNDQSQMTRAELGYGGAAMGATINAGKQLNQNLTWMEDFLRWRNEFYTNQSTTVRRKAGIRRRRGGL